MSWKSIGHQLHYSEAELNGDKNISSSFSSVRCHLGAEVDNCCNNFIAKRNMAVGQF